MEKEKPFAIDWLSIKSGTVIKMKDFPSVRLLKLDDRKGCYFNPSSEDDGTLVDIVTYKSEVNGEYYAFKVTEEDWHPITSRLWNL